VGRAGSPARPGLRLNCRGRLIWASWLGTNQPSQRRAIWLLRTPLSVHQPHQPHPRQLYVACDPAAYAFGGGSAPAPDLPIRSVSPHLLSWSNLGTTLQSRETRWQKPKILPSRCLGYGSQPLPFSYRKKIYPCPRNMEFFFGIATLNLVFVHSAMSGGKISAASPPHMLRPLRKEPRVRSGES
jgi:hypothetical protein